MANCNLCGNSENISEYELSDGCNVELCEICKTQIESGKLDEGHFNCLNDSMWSEEKCVKVLSFVLWQKLGRADMSDMMYLEEEESAIAEAILSADANKIVVKDANGVELKAGDSVVILKDLDVKGAGFTAKRGTTVRNISIPQDVEGHIEGRVNGTKIYLKTEFLKKA
jgi:protein PhnA